MPASTKDIVATEETKARLLDYTQNGRLKWDQLIRGMFKALDNGQTNLSNVYGKVYQVDKKTAKENLSRLKRNANFCQQLNDYITAQGWNKAKTTARFADIAKRAKSKEALMPEIMAIKEVGKLGGFYPDQKLRVEGNLGLYQAIIPTEELPEELDNWGTDQD